MIYKSNKCSHPFSRKSHQSPFGSIEVIGGGKDIRNNLPFFGELDEELEEIEDEKYNGMEETKRHTQTTSKFQRHIQVEKCLRRNKRLEAKLSKALNWIIKAEISKSQDITAKRIINSPNKIQPLPDRAGDIDRQSRLEDSLSYPQTLSFSQGESHVMEPNIATIQDAIIAHARTFNIYRHDADQFIICLEEYKNAVKNYVSCTLSSEKAFKRFKKSLQLQRVLQKRLDRSIKNYFKLAEHECWNSFTDYFLLLTPDIISDIQKFMGAYVHTAELPLLNMQAVNRLSAILKALKYCQDEDINFDLFQNFIKLHTIDYLQSAQKSDSSSQLYPGNAEFPYLLALRREEIMEELRGLCGALQGPVEVVGDCAREEILEAELHSIAQGNGELKARIRKRIESERLDKRTRDKGLINSYEKYMLTLKKKKEEPLSDNQCSTEYTDKKESNPLING
eukprot:TRINITY_DN4284_c0_g1_i4.p1 TRINITY_DN4284_c0_g1~~TRINITY_DN4284_c0_g1_i4.p1  ORF type:complete len:451 (+),score=52.46 TRINITY_DN4284_c0_g1_i4:145-1497(+)